MPKIKLSINNKSLSPLELFLKKHRANTEFTHTSITNPPASYYIDPKNSQLQQEFFEKYYDHVFIKNKNAHLTEGIRDCHITPVKIDMDFRFWQEPQINDKPKRIYDLEDIIKICQLYMKKMEQWFITPDPDERHCFILQKDNPVYDIDKKSKSPKKNEQEQLRVKDGVHIMFPYLCTETELQLIFRDDVYKSEECDVILGKFNFDNAYADIFDKAVIDRNNWQMYGSSKNKDAQAYKVVKIVEIYENDYKEIPLNTYTSKELVKLLSVRNKDELSMLKIEKKTELEEYKNKRTVLAMKKRKYSKKGKKKKFSVSKKELAIIYEYVDCLSINRAINHDTWIEVGWALHNIHNKTDHLLKKWMDWGRQTGTGYEKEPDSSYIEAWDSMRDFGLGIGSLKLWAKEDNPNKYQETLNKDLHPLIYKCIGKKGKGSSYDVAKVMLHMFKDEYVCVSIKDNLWYYYNKEEHRWVEDDKGINLKKKISVEIFQLFNKEANNCSHKSYEAGDEWDEKKDKLWKISSRLKETSFKSNIMTECAELFYDFKREFFNKLDSNLNLLGFDNGILDLETGEFRKGRPEDYVSMSTKIEYIPYDEHSQEVQDIYKFMSQVLTNRNVREFVIKLMATFLSGSTKSEKFHVWSGSGGNGKSKVIELLERSVGEYAGKMNISNLTQKRGSASGANPELARTKGKRFVNMQEPDEKTKLNVGLMKELTGGDKIIARALFKEPIEFKPQFKMVLTCNDKPELPPDDEGTWRRVVLVEFNSKFRHEPDGEYINGEWIPASEKNPEFPIDESLNEKFDDWAEPFMSILVHVYMANKNKDLIEPSEVKEYTNKYREGQDHFQEFANDKIITLEEDDVENSKLILINVLFDEYKNWYKDNHGNNNHKKRSELKSYMDKKFNKYWVEGTTYSKRGWRGIKILDSCSIDSDRDELD